MAPRAAPLHYVNTSQSPINYTVHHPPWIVTAKPRGVASRLGQIPRVPDGVEDPHRGMTSWRKMPSALDAHTRIHAQSQFSTTDYCVCPLAYSSPEVVS